MACGGLVYTAAGRDGSFVIAEGPRRRYGLFHVWRDGAARHMAHGTLPELLRQELYIPPRARTQFFIDLAEGAILPWASRPSIPTAPPESPGPDAAIEDAPSDVEAAAAFWRETLDRVEARIAKGALGAQVIRDNLAGLRR